MIEVQIDKLLKKSGRTFYWLAKETGISHTTLWRLKKGKALGINFATLEKICQALRCGGVHSGGQSTGRREARPAAARRGRAAALLPYDPVKDCVVLIEQYRIPALAAGLDPVLAELPAGLCEEDEAAGTTANCAPPDSQRRNASSPAALGASMSRSTTMRVRGPRDPPRHLPALSTAQQDEGRRRCGKPRGWRGATTRNRFAKRSRKRASTPSCS